jgi:hypothetical protein
VSGQGLREECIVRGWVWIVIGALLTLVGLTWMLQGLNVLGGSAMSGKTLWAVIGPIVGVVGLALIGLGVRTVRRAPTKP